MLSRTHRNPRSLKQLSSQDGGGVVDPKDSSLERVCHSCQQGLRCTCFLQPARWDAQPCGQTASAAERRPG